MRVVCDNCGATYKIPEHKLQKEVNKATCRKCGHRMLIRRPSAARPSPSAPPVAAGSNDEETRLTRSPLQDQASAEAHQAAASGWAEESPTRIAPSRAPAKRSMSAHRRAGRAAPAGARDRLGPLGQHALPPPPAGHTHPCGSWLPRRLHAGSCAGSGRSPVSRARSTAARRPWPCAQPAPVAAAPRAAAPPAFDPSGDLGWALAGA